MDARTPWMVSVAIVAGCALVHAPAGCASKSGGAAAGGATSPEPSPLMEQKRFLCGDKYLARGRIGIHGDCLNSDYRPEEAPRDFGGATYGYALNNNVTFMNASLDFELKRAYTTTAKSNDQSNLHAIDGHATGDDVIAWRSKPFDKDGDWRGGGPDACAMVDTPIIDSDHNVYVSDCRYVFSYTPTGDERFRHPLPGFDPTATTYTPTFPCPEGLAFTHTGRLVCVQGDANVVVFNIDDPGQVSIIDQLRIQGAMPAPDPGAVAPDINPFLDGIFKDDGLDEEGVAAPGMDPYMMDEGLRNAVFAAALGSTKGPPVANAPAVIRDARPGREKVSMIFTTVSIPGEGDDDCRLFRIDYDDSTGELIQPEEYTGGYMMDGGGSGASPTITLDGGYVFSADNEGLTYKWSTWTGQEAPGWEGGRRLGIYPGSAVLDLSSGILYQPVAGDGKAVTVDGEVLEEGRSYLVRADAETGTLLAAWNYDYLAKEVVDGKPRVPPFPGYERVAMPNTSPTVNGSVLLMGFNLGYRLNIDQLSSVIWPMQSILVALDPDTGAVLGSPARLVDSSEAYPIVDEQGTVYIGLTGIFSSITTDWYDKGMFPLPRPLPPNGGFQVIHASGDTP